MQRHRLDPLSLLGGFLFVGLGAVFLRGTDVTTWPWHVVAPLALAVVTGMVLLALLLALGRPRDGGRR